MENKNLKLKLACEGCPALPLRTDSQLKKINHWYALRLQQLEEIKIPKVILLCESFPKDRFIYDLQTSYNNSGLRYNLKTELYNLTCSDKQFLANLQSEKIMIVDCAFCPLFFIDSNTYKRKAATHCLQQHSLPLLQQFAQVPIITIFPLHRGFLKRQLPDITKRIKAEFDFGNLLGLKQTIKLIE